MSRRLHFKENDQFNPCPKCGNNTQFTAESQQVCEDGCEVWVVCVCGYDPTSGTGDRVESMMGGTSDDNVRVALDVWNESTAR